MLISNEYPVGELSEIIKTFIAHKRSLGFKYKIEEHALILFSILSLEYDVKGQIIPNELLETYFEKRNGEKNTTYNARIGLIKKFLDFSRKYDCEFSLPEVPKLKNEKYQPYIFTSEEMSRFFNASDNLKHYTGSQRHIIVPVLFRLIYSCGLRSTEAASLKSEHIDWEHNTLTIYNGKNSKDRLIPFSGTLKSVLETYYIRYRRNDCENTFLFPSKYNEHLTRGMVYKWFRYTLETAGIPHGGKGFGPREHDLRHSFCVHTLKNMHSQGIDLYVCLPLLSNYLGHVSIRETQDYLRLSAEFYPEVEKIMREYTGNIIPNGGAQNETN
jgi:integrase